MTFGERMKELLDQGVEASRDFAAKAGAKAKDLGERGMIAIEVKQLEGQAQRLLGRLGNVAYLAFTEQDRDSIGKDMPEVRLILAELADVRDSIERKQKESETRGGRG